MSEQKPIATPCAFLSYSWSSPQHQDWVIDLARRLVEDGVDIKLDKWDLKPGHDSYQFMELMVTDPGVTKVLMICDKVYTDKANSRSGGVGTESQIISPELYGKGTQDKFAALITELDDKGKDYVPIFYKGRIYFNFSMPELFEESYEQLLRWLVDQPLHVKPKLGSIPQSILQVAPAANSTVSRAKRAEEAIRQGTLSAAALVREYGETLVPEIRSFEPKPQNLETYDDDLMVAVDAIRPYLRQFVELATVAVRYSQDERVWERILAIHEQLGRLMFRPPEINQWRETDFDTFKIVAHDAFIATIAVALSEERFDLVTSAIRRAWLVNPGDGSNRSSTCDYTVFNDHIATLHYRNQRLKLNRADLHADLLRQTYSTGGLPNFEAIMQADFVLFLRSVIVGVRGRWYPFSLLYATNRYRPFELFARAESKTYFLRLMELLGVSSVEAFKQKIAEVQGGDRTQNMFNHHGLPVSYLANSQHIGTLP